MFWTFMAMEQCDTIDNMKVYFSPNAIREYDSNAPRQTLLEMSLWEKLVQSMHYNKTITG